MRRTAISTKFFGIGIIASIFVSACADPSSPIAGENARLLRARAAKNITAASLGEVPGGLIEPKSEFVPVVAEGGKLSQGKMIKDSKIVINVANNEECPVKVGTKVSFIALNGAFARVLAPAKCNNSELEVEVEGFVALADILEDPVVATPTAASSSSPGVLVATGAVPGAVVAAAAAQVFPGCSKVFQDNGVLKNFLTWAKMLSVENGLCGDGSSCVFPGLMFRDAKKFDSFFLVIKGNAARWRVTIPGVGETTVDAAPYAAGDNAFRIRMADIIKHNDHIGTSEKFLVQGLNADGSNAGGECKHSVKLISPLVLDLRGTGSFQGESLAESTVKFDLKATGEQLQTGWIKPTMGLLVLDRNSNGRVDNGSELFGEAYRLANKKLATNGYEALADLDSNKDGIIDASDSFFGKLSVWVDANSNGLTEKGELRSLAAMQIQKIGLDYSPSLRHGVRDSLDNDVRYESRFWGPAHCGVQGCLSFDVYFATAQSVSYNDIVNIKK